MKTEQFAVSTFFYTHMSDAESMLQSVSDAGIAAIELYASAPHLCELYKRSAEERAAMLERWKELLHRYPVKIRALLIPTFDLPVNIADENDEIRLFSIAMTERLIEDAAELGVPGLVLDSGFGLYDKDRNAAWNRSLDALQRLAVKAGECGTDLYLRPVGPWTNLVSTAQELEEMLDLVQNPSLKACLDCGILGADAAGSFLKRFGKKAAYCRIPNFQSEGEFVEGKSFGVLKSLISALEANDFAGGVTIEIGWERLDQADAAAHKLAEVLNKEFS